jgi:hypothetical protein
LPILVSFKEIKNIIFENEISYLKNGVTTLYMTAFSIMTLCVTTFSTTMNKMRHIAMLNVVIVSVVMLNVSMISGLC